MFGNVVVIVSVSIISNGKILMIKEYKPNAYNKWNFPSGHIEWGEDILNAACREVKEETGLDINLLSTTGVYNFLSLSKDHIILFHFIGEIIGGSLLLEEQKIIDSKWVTINDILRWDTAQLREGIIIKNIAERLYNGINYPIALFSKLIAKEQ
ncbi:NUDIX domain-containing protein [Paenibacillus macerans]|uniref:NUDIX domain-containing protein n=1 Tax=Paenibacillus macerans TaxID=44252 RepID=A0A6N8EV56_PAEMA|nr:NUDIX domain-containing protein [Paenibacillus macerans]MUG22412.1 NUDIX domain-containing protein [Paenibacillus macerans]UMV49175.1 NUDIX domain-containing protein [Paenibacillus macerans]GBK65290.1 hypothetical protein PbDSM24746_52940 [Paenibacillus macerans]GBK71533.1 hypothetical protein PbJCM17693_52410 [Paenibacillus macerans]GIP09555.1 hypothetical protein J1TS5_17250 [Paenibacillus macerans]